jgi:dinuclear metal center YbgI/SA1388 family protein
VKLQRIIDALTALSPLEYAEPWDKVGLQIGDPAQDVKRGLLCIDLTPQVVAEAVAKRASLIVAYHPPIFEPVTNLVTGKRSDWRQRVITELVRRRIAVFTPHTALDAAVDGVNDWLADGLGAGKSTPISPRVASARQPGDLLKLAVFVPVDHADAVRSAMSAAGSGLVGNYTDCSFNVVGEGTFMPLANANPTIGKRGRLERVAEVRVEVICRRDKLAPVIAAMKAAHPYEETAFDLYPLETPPGSPGAMNESAVGQGRLVKLDNAVTLDTLVSRVKKRLRVARLDVSMPAGFAKKTPLSSVALCAGAGGSVVKLAEGKAQVYLSGEMRHHDILEAVQRGKIVLLAGHTQTERPYLPTYQRRIEKSVGNGVSWRVSDADVAP